MTQLWPLKESHSLYSLSKMAFRTETLGSTTVREHSEWSAKGRLIWVKLWLVSTQLSKTLAVSMAFCSFLSISERTLLLFSYLCSLQNNSYRLYFRPCHSVSWNMKWSSKIITFFLKRISVREIAVTLMIRHSAPKSSQAYRVFHVSRRKTLQYS